MDAHARPVKPVDAHLGGHITALPRRAGVSVHLDQSKPIAMRTVREHLGQSSNYSKVYTGFTYILLYINVLSIFI